MSSSRPAPAVPLELQAHIISFCDTSTLAVACSVNVAWLVLASRLLYRDITILGPHQLELLFCAASPPRLASLDPFLSLDGVRSITFVGDLRSHTSRPNVDRIVGGELSLERLTLVHVELDEWSECNIHTNFEALACLRPQTLAIRSPLSPANLHGSDWLLLSRVRTLELEGVLFRPPSCAFIHQVQEIILRNSQRTVLWQAQMWDAAFRDPRFIGPGTSSTVWPTLVLRVEGVEAEESKALEISSRATLSYRPHVWSPVRPEEDDVDYQGLAQRYRALCD